MLLLAVRGANAWQVIVNQQLRSRSGARDR
jgi:hypothetical protein